MGGEAMGFLDDAKGLADKAKDLAGDHADEVEDGIDKAADFADDKSGGKYEEQIDSGADAAKGMVRGLDDE
jgi:hypothetical protein